VGGRKTAELTSDEPVFVVRGVDPARGVNLRVWAANDEGESEGEVLLEAAPSKVAELQIGEFESWRMRMDLTAAKLSSSFFSFSRFLILERIGVDRCVKKAAK